MTENRRQFSAQFKAEAVHMVVGLGRSLAAVTRDLEGIVKLLKSPDLG